MGEVYSSAGYRRHRAAILALIVCGVSWNQAPAIAQDDDRPEDHQALIDLREKFTEALNNRDFEALKPLVTDSLTFISISNEKISGLNELKAYWEKLFEGAGSILKSMTVAPVADARTTFFGDSVGVTQGTSVDTFEFRKVGFRQLTTRWTAVVVKAEGQWKVARIHSSANVLDNPVLDANSFVGNLKMGAGAVLGFLLALMAAVLFRRLRAK